MPIYLLRRMVSLSSTFQTLVGATTAAQAIEHIYCKDTDGTERRPCAVIMHGRTGYSLTAGGMQNQLRPSGSVYLWLFVDRDEDDIDNNADGILRFGNVAGGVTDDVVNLAGVDQTTDTTVTGSHLQITSVSSVDIGETHPELRDSMGWFWWAEIVFEWGDS